MVKAIIIGKREVWPMLTFRVQQMRVPTMKMYNGFEINFFTACIGLLGLPLNNRHLFSPISGGWKSR